MFYVKSGFPTEKKPTIVKLTLSNMFASCAVCGKEVHLTPEEVTTNIMRLMNDSYLCPLCRNELICELCGDDFEEDDDDFDDDEEDCDDAEDDPEYEDALDSDEKPEGFSKDGSDYSSITNELARAAAAEAERRFGDVPYAEYEKTRREIMAELKKLIYGNPNPRVEHIVSLQEACNGKI